MGERKGQNKYYPPDYDPKKGGLNKFLGTHALRERARKIHLGIIIIRFEMPYNIWCLGCKNHIGMGVRYNAEKTKLGMYFSTPIYQFKMKCHLCENYIEIKTDPENFDYVIVSGARRQERRWDPTDNGQVVPDTTEFQMKLVDDPMFKLEHEANDLKAADDAKPRLAKLYQRNEDVWRDNYDANCKLRATFRVKRKELLIEKERDKELLGRTSLNINLLPETNEDRSMAALMRLQSQPAQEREEERRLDILNKPALPSVTETSFGGVKRQKLMNNKLNSKALGIIAKRKSHSSSSTNSNSKYDENSSSSNDAVSSKLNGHTSISVTCEKVVPNEPESINLSKALALVGEYSSSNDSD